MKTILYAVLTFVLTVNLIPASAQTDKATIEKLIESKNFIFNASRANPISEASLNQMMGPTAMNNILDLSNGRNYLRITKEAVTADLPFFGRSYSAPMNPDNAGTKFTSKDFTYSVVKKKRNWIITIVPKDVRDGQQLNLRVSESGAATLNVNNYNRQAISFEGSINAIETAD